MILEVQTEINYDDKSQEGMRYVATKVEVLTSSEKIKTPNNGKVITLEEFQKVQKKFLEKQMEMYSDRVEKDLNLNSLVRIFFISNYLKSFPTLTRFPPIPFPDGSLP